MSNFFEYCPTCRKMFQDPKAWNEHKLKHKLAKKQKGKKEVPEKAPDLTVPGQDEAGEDLRLEQSKELRGIKQKLQKAGVEGYATMNLKEAKAALAKVEPKPKAKAKAKKVK